MQIYLQNSFEKVDFVRENAILWTLFAQKGRR